MTTNLYTECADQVRILEASPAFAMSLGAKELFHTNFLAFILEDQSPSLASIRIALRKTLKIEYRDGESTSCKVWRESNSLDLVVIPFLEDGSKLSQRVLVVEAKLKSTPTVEQLNNYTEKIRKGFTLEGLLTIPSETSREVGRVLLSTKHKLNLEGTGWQHVEWSELSCALRSACTQIGETSLLELLVKDYCASLEALITILNKADNYLQVSSGWHSLNFGIVDFKKIRLHDLLGKYLATHKVSQIANEIGGASAITNISHNSFYSNQSPGFSVYRSFKDANGKELMFGLQVQGSEVRRFIQSPPKNGVTISSLLPEPPEKSKLPDKWFLQDDFTGRRNNPEIFKKFDANRFRYTAKNIEKMEWKDLIKEIKTSLQKVNDLASNLGLTLVEQ